MTKPTEFELHGTAWGPKKFLFGEFGPEVNPVESLEEADSGRPDSGRNGKMAISLEEPDSGHPGEPGEPEELGEPGEQGEPEDPTSLPTTGAALNAAAAQATAPTRNAARQAEV
jgi:hypothetical protein